MSVRSTWVRLLVLVGLLFPAACSDESTGTNGAGDADTGTAGDAAGADGTGACPGSAYIVGMIVHDERDGNVTDSAFIVLNEQTNPERPIDCPATVVIVAGSTETTLVLTRPGQYEAGLSGTGTTVPPITLVPGAEHQLQVDLGSDGSVDITGEVTLSDITNFRTTSVSSTQVSFAWDDAGDVGNTAYSVQASDQADFLFPDNFASGMVEGTTSITFGGSSEWPYFDAPPPLYARIQSDTAGTLSSDGRFTAADWPIEPILQY